MKPIEPPLRPSFTGENVVNLQDALLFLIDRQRIQLPQPNPLLVSPNPVVFLRRDRDTQTYNDGTALVIKLFREQYKDQFHLTPGDDVDVPTADALNTLLKDLDAFTEPSQKWQVHGRVTKADGSSVAGNLVLAFDNENVGGAYLGSTNTNIDGAYQMYYDPSLYAQPGEGVLKVKAVLDLIVQVYDAAGATLATSQPLHDPGREVQVDLQLAARPSQTSLYRVQGKVASRVSAGIGGLRVVITDKGVGGDVKLSETTTDEGGAYQVSIPEGDVRQRGKSLPDLQARVFRGDVTVGASEVRYNATPQETLNVLLDDQAATALRSEHEVLTSVLAASFNGKLHDLKETDEQQDITYLANKTGWDARAVALGALADQFSAQTTEGAGAQTIPPSFFYALFRAGLPANEHTLYHTDAKTLEAVWNKAAEQAVIPQPAAGQIPNLIARFRELRKDKLLTSPALVGASSMKDLLTASRLDEAQQKQFAELYVDHEAGSEAFWSAVKTAFPDKVTQLQVDGKLAFLTINNAPLMQKVHATIGAKIGMPGVTDTLQLAQMGYHRPELWSALLADELPIPNEIPGDKPEIKRANYASYLAAQVRLSYPTAAIAQMVKSGDLPLTGTTSGVSDDVHAFLTQHQGNFEIGGQPVQQYLTQNNVKVADATVQQVKRLQRAYQMTSSDQAFTALMKRGIDAAYQVVRYDKDTFVQSFATDVGGANHAALIYDRSAQIHNTILNIALSYLSARTSPAIGVHSPPSYVNPMPANAGDVIASATLESLFGSMDFCTCDHCRSILSPAAYLVDLLLFLQSDEQLWTEFTKNWMVSHLAPYPFASKDAWDKAGKPSNTDISPFDVLMSRRPDIQHLPLTCENTNTALPYIDVVNETLEYFIANTSQTLSLKDYEGHDTKDAESEDLLASPQFVMDAAYKTLRDERFPSPLPFHQTLEKLRRYFNKFDVSLPLAMERLRKTDDLERGDANSYGWRDILMEEIGLSRAEYEILTDARAVPLWRMYGFPSGTSDPDVIAALSNAKLFARHSAISYEDLISILRTRFINPNSDLIPKLERLGVNFAILAELKTKNDPATDAKFDTILAALAVPPDPAEYGDDIKAWVKKDDNYARIVGIITLAIPTRPWEATKPYAVRECVRPSTAPSESFLYFECTTAGTSGSSEPIWPTIPGETITNDGTVVWTCRDASSCLSFDNLAFRYADPDKAAQNISPVDFIRLLRFTRLWRKLGWTVQETDAVICALYRADLTPLDVSDLNDVTPLNDGFLTLLPRIGIVRRVMKILHLTVKRDLLPLLACWSEIGTHGAEVLYRQMFLNPAVLEQDTVFADNGYGEFLVDPTQKVALHAEPLRSAFNLSGEEYDLIVADLQYDENTILTIPNISAIFRRGWLARKLKLSVRELLRLIQFTGLDPFAVPDPTDPAILRLISLVQNLKDRSLKSTSALYLIWNQDLNGKLVPDSAQVAGLARTLRGGLLAVETEFAIVQDPDSAVAQTRMAMVYGADATFFFFGLLNDTLTVEVEFSDPDSTFTIDDVRRAIENAAGKTDAGVSRIAYDEFRKLLSYSGVLPTSTREAMKAAAGAGAGKFKTAVDELYNNSQLVTTPFFARYPELQSPYNTYVADTGRVPEKRGSLLNAILPELIQRRKRQQALQSISAVTNTDLTFSQTFLDPPAAPFELHAVDHTDQPALNDVLRLEDGGLSVQFFANDIATGTVIPGPDVASSLSYTPLANGVGNPLPSHPVPGAAVSGVWEGYLEAPESGFFNLHIEADSSAGVRLVLDEKPVALTQNGTVWNNASPIQLQGGALFPIRLTVEKVRDVMHVRWDWAPKGQGRALIPARYLYPAVPFGAFEDTYIRFLKTASLSTGLGLSCNELAYFGTHADYQINKDGWLNALAVSGDPPPNIASALLKPFQALLDFARIKADISAGDESLLSVLKDPAAATEKIDSLLFLIARWNQASLSNVLGQFNANIASLEHFDMFRRVYDAFALIQTMGISSKTLIQATTNEPTAETVRSLQAALRARYDPVEWREVVRPINDEMRALQRDAMVAYILHQMRSDPEKAHINTPEKLFEYFLMDVQMDPCMETSRIRHALSSVQLFIERSIMNLEPRVLPAAFNGKQWGWMKRYRVWEANRKVYLYPENWLEPELRDDKSPFFKDIESELLQSDITEDSAETALLNYLSKLEEVAKLEPCGIYHAPRDDNKRTPEINHLVARTAGAHRKYFYRRHEGSSWTPWEQIKLDIEDNPVVPYVWNDRLFVFWLRILKKGPETVDQGLPPGRDLASVKTSDINVSPPEVTVQAVLCWSEYYNGKWQPTKTSDVNRPTSLAQILPPHGGSTAGFRGPASPAQRVDKSFGLNEFDRSKLSLSTQLTPTGLRVSIRGPGSSSFFLYNTHSLPLREEDGFQAVGIDPRVRDFDTSTDTFTINYREMGKEPLKRAIVQNGVPDRAISPQHRLQNSWDAPFLYEDSRHVFFVTTMEERVQIVDFDKYGVHMGWDSKEVVQIPGLVSKVDYKVQVKPMLWGDGRPIGPNLDAVDPGPMKRLVTEDAYIRHGIGTTAVVKYGDKEIIPAGARMSIQNGE